MCRAASAARCAEESIEDLSKLGVEDGVDDRIEGAVDVAEPDEARQHQRVDATERRRATVRLVVADVLADADRVDDVDREERQPAEQKHGYTRDHISPVLSRLHWLPVKQRAVFKLAIIVFKSLRGETPSYLADDCQLIADVLRTPLSSLG